MNKINDLEDIVKSLKKATKAMHKAEKTLSEITYDITSYLIRKNK